MNGKPIPATTIFHENNLNKYKFVIIAKITMNRIRMDENVFSILARKLAVFFKYRDIKYPMASGTIRHVAYMTIC